MHEIMKVKSKKMENSYQRTDKFQIYSVALLFFLNLLKTLQMIPKWYKKLLQENKLHVLPAFYNFI